MLLQVPEYTRKKGAVHSSSYICVVWYDIPKVTDYSSSAKLDGDSAEEKGTVEEGWQKLVLKEPSLLALLLLRGLKTEIHRYSSCHLRCLRVLQFEGLRAYNIVFEYLWLVPQSHSLWLNTEYYINMYRKEVIQC